MNENLMQAGAFAAIWLGTWLALQILQALIYPLLRPALSRLHPAPASSLALLWMALPMTLGLLSTTLLFMPEAEDLLVAAHCHSDCGAHSPQFRVPWLQAAGLVVLLAMMIWLAWHASRSLLLSRRLHRQLAAVAVARGPWQVLPETGPLVFTIGWRRPRIYITEGLLRQCSSAELTIMLAHEYEHGRRRDNARLLLGKLFLLPLPNVLASTMITDLQLFAEASCDAAAARDNDSADVATTLLRMHRLVPSRFHLAGSEMTTAFTGAEVERRIRLLLENRLSPRHPIVTLISGVLAVLMLALVLVNPLHQLVEALASL
ncbi:MAG TPA: M48 family metalloprotease [Candidatus Acidoferrum sp.]|nr:M48 family metalloprotease [Candidatus Acidoferrum sp.]